MICDATIQQLYYKVKFGYVDWAVMSELGNSSSICRMFLPVTQTWAMSLYKCLEYMRILVLTPLIGQQRRLYACKKRVSARNKNTIPFLALIALD